MDDYKEKVVDAVIEEMKRDLNEYNDRSCLYQLLYDNVDIKILEQYLPEGQDQTIEQLEAALEATRQKIAEQLSLVGKSIQSIDPTLHEKERELEQAIHYLEKGSFILDSIDDYRTREQANLADLIAPHEGDKE